MLRKIEITLTYRNILPQLATWKFVAWQVARVVDLFLRFNFRNWEENLKTASEYMQDPFLFASQVRNYNLKGGGFDVQLPKPETNFLKRAFSYRIAVACNELSNDLKHEW